MRAGRLHILFFGAAVVAAAFLYTRAAAAQDTDAFIKMYREYWGRLDRVEQRADIDSSGFNVIENQVFPMTMESFGEVSFIPALDSQYNRLVIFIAGEDGHIIYKTDELETNNRKRGELAQPNETLAAVSFQDMNGDGLTDILLISFCVDDSGSGDGRTYKIGDVLFQDKKGFYRDYRLSGKLNRFGMNKSIRFIVSFVRDGYSTEFLYTATTLKELTDHGFKIISEQFCARQFEKFGKLVVVPGTYRMAEYHVFMIYLLNDQGYIVWSLQPMEEYENLYALKGLNCGDIDGDGMIDITVLGSYSYEGPGDQTVIVSDYSIYYQRTGGFIADTDVKSCYTCTDSDTLGDIVEKARAFWGWKSDL